jgi:hypothetical protein
LISIGLNCANGNKPPVSGEGDFGLRKLKGTSVFEHHAMRPPWPNERPESSISNRAADRLDRSSSSIFLNLSRWLSEAFLP